MGEWGLSSIHQWAFKKDFSKEYLMLHLTETWKSFLDKGKVVGVLFLDFRKAFDSVCHETLIKKTQAVGISGSLLKLLENYLYKMRQYVKINGECSSKMPVKFGVPQVSLLAPRLFAIQVNDLSNCTTQATIEMLADGSQCYSIGDTVDDLIESLQKTVDDKEKWCIQSLPKVLGTPIN